MPTASAISPALIDEEMRAADLTLSRPTRARRSPRCSAATALASRNEIRKLALYANGQKQIELADVMAVVADASALALDGVIDAAFAGRPADVETEFGKARAGGSSPAAIVSAAIRQVANLHKMKLAVDAGDCDRIRHEARRAAGAFHAREGGRRSAARLVAAASYSRHGAARGSLARHAAQRRAGGSDRAAHPAGNRDECATKRKLTKLF